MKDWAGNTALIWAVKKGHAEVAKELIGAKANVNVNMKDKDKDGNTLLILASNQSNTKMAKEVAKELIGAKTDVNVKDEFGKTPLIWAVEGGHTEIANMIRARVRMLMP